MTASRLIWATIAFLAASSPNICQARDIYRQFRTDGGSDVTLYTDGTAYISNAIQRFSHSGRWKKDKGRDCAEWNLGRAQCF